MRWIALAPCLRGDDEYDNRRGKQSTSCLRARARVATRRASNFSPDLERFMSVTKDDVRRIATLARIAEPADRLDALTGELNGILDWVEQLNEVDVDGVEPMTSAAPMKLPMRR